MREKRKHNGNILIVDDNHQNLQVLGSILIKEGYNVNAINNSLKVIDYMKNNSIDLVLMDIMMPEMDGLTLCDNIKKIDTLKEIPIIFMTAYNDTEHQVIAFKKGGVDYITKPFQNEVVLARVKTHITLKKQYEELKVSNATKDKFFSIIAHDLRNPVSVIMGFSQDDSLEVDFATTKQYIYQSSKQMLKFIDALSVWNENQKGTISIQPVNIALKDIITECKNILFLKLKEKDITIDTDFNSDFNLVADYHVLVIVLNNLITNAIKFSNIKSTISINAKEDEENYQIHIKDPGIGIPEEILSKIFQLGELKSRKGTNGERGTGLGLIICRDLIEKHNGSITIESKINEGTVVTITIPKP